MLKHAMLGISLLALAAGPLWMGDWVVDDAAISYAYAENLVAGEGLVAVPGGERVEGYSNPLWVLLLSIGAALDLDLFGFSKVLATFCALSAGLFAYRIDRSWLAPAFLAVSGPFLIWTASGLENPLFTALLLAGVVAGREQRFGWAGVAFGLLALTRPEALVYGLVAGGIWTLQGASMRRYWFALIGLFTVHEGFRIAYFAWPLPNTYYAKLGAPIERWGWEARGWRQLRQWGWETGFGFLLPLVLLGLPRRWVIGAMALLPAAFSIYAGGDWMRGFRWMSLAAGPLAVLLAGGLLWAHERWGSRVLWLLGGLAFGGLLPANVQLLQGFRANPVDHPTMVARRLHYIQGVADRLGIPPRERSTLEMDMGAHLWLSDLEVVDLAGLVDIPIARHSFADRSFLRHYIFEERRPLFAHVHRHWARASKLREFPEWKRDYVELPAYEDEGRKHGGVFIRRDALVKPWTGAPRNDALGGLRLVGAEVAAEGRHQLIVRLAVELTEGPRDLWLEAGGKRWTVDPGHGVLKSWRGTAVTRHRLPLGIPLGQHVLRAGVGNQSVELGRFMVVVDVRPEARLLNALQGSCEEMERNHTRILDRLPPADWLAEARPERRVAQCWLERGGIEGIVRARRWDRTVPGLAAARAPLVDRRYAEGLAALASGAKPRAHQAFMDVLGMRPEHAWARRYAEESR